MTTNTGFNQTRYRRRRVQNNVIMATTLAMTSLGLIILGTILYTLLYNGLSAINLDLFIQRTPAGNDLGGLGNAIIGSMIITFLAMIIGTPIGIMAGTYLVEYGGKSRVSTVIQFVNDILLSAPSIVVGVFIWNAVVIPTHQYSGYAGAIALSILVIPVIVRTTFDMLSLVPNSLREAAAALGTPKWKMISLICYKAAFQGMLTGIMLGFARISGETAPLLFTSGTAQNWINTIAGPVASLPVTIFEFANSPYENLHRLAWGGALLVTASILFLNILARSLSSLSTKR